MLKRYKRQQQQQQRPFNGLWSGTTRVGRYQKKHSPTHTHPDQRASFITFLHPLYSTYVLDSPHVQPISRSSLVFLLVLNHQLHAPYISWPSHRHLFATHDRTSAACSAAVPMLCHLHLVSLSAPYLGVYLQETMWNILSCSFKSFEVLFCGRNACTRSCTCTCMMSSCNISDVTHAVQVYTRSNNTWKVENMQNKYNHGCNSVG